MTDNNTIAITKVTSMNAVGGAGAKAGKKKGRAVNPWKERSCAFIGCLYELHRRNSRYCFTAAFIDKMFRPYLLDKKFRWNGDIREAVKLWCSDPAAAEERYGHISQWDVSCVTNMGYLFREKSEFNDNIQAWDVSKVMDMGCMFEDAAAFNQPLAAWKVSKVKNMYYMFGGARSFNQPLDAWDMSSVTSMMRMFDQCPISERNRPGGAM